MTDKTEGDALTESQSLVDSFHKVGSLVPKDQSLAKITKDMTVGKALELMEKNHFSQLPVVAGKKVLGVFSYRSFSQEAARRQRSERNKVLADLPVEEFMEDYSFVAANQDWTKVQSQLDEKDGFFVGHPDEISGLVTTMDVYQYFRNIADPFILVAEIEVPLRNLISQQVPKDKRAEIFERVLAGSYAAGKIPKRPIDLSLTDEVLIVTAHDYWHYFQDVFGKETRSYNTTKDKLKDIPDLRNDAFHFKRKLKAFEVKKLVDCRNWLHRTIRAYEGEREGKVVRPEKTTEPAVSPNSSANRRPKTAGIRELVNTVLQARFTPPYPEDITDQICLRIEGNPEWLASYHSLSAELSGTDAPEDWKVNNAITKHVRELTGMENAGTKQKSKNGLMKNYSRLRYPV